MDGYAFDYCGPEEGRVTQGLGACRLPASYGGVPVYDCVAYNQSGPAPAAPWCFGPGGAPAPCRPLTCSQGVQRACPAGTPPLGGGATALAPWAAPACAEALCATRGALANVSACALDTPAERAELAAAFAGLNASAEFPAALAAAADAAGAAPPGAAPPASLSAHCNARFGQLCLDDVIDPACPAVFRSDNQWMVRTGAATLCDPGCLRALCGLQQRRRHFNATTGDVCADADLEMLIRWEEGGWKCRKASA
jgi:hypothetical protein